MAQYGELLGATSADAARTGEEARGEGVTGATRGMGPLSAGDLAELLAAFNDVTAKLQASHEKLRADVARLNEELAQANEQVERSRRLAALGEMAAGIAHEVRNPLGSIRLYARMLEEDLTGKERELAAKITRATRAVEGIVGDVLAFAREFKLRRDRVCCAEAMRRAWEACAHEAGADGVRVEFEGAEGVEVRADGALLHQALTNVICNAVQAMGGSDAVAVANERAGPAAHGATARLKLSWEASHRTLRAKRREGVVVLRVRDFGPGVTPDVVARMFNPFFTTRAQGTGLGLAIVHRIIDAHGGRVSVANNDGAGGFVRGACVEIVLPARATSSGDDGERREGEGLVTVAGRVREVASRSKKAKVAQAQGPN